MKAHEHNYNISGLRVNHRSIINQHLNQDYDELPCEIAIDRLKQKYQLFNNEALYVIDCKYAQLEPLSKNFKKILGHWGPHKNELSLLYTHVSKTNYSAVINWVEAVLDGIFDKCRNLQPEDDVSSCIYLSNNDKVILKSTTPLVYDSNGTMRYSMGKLTDLTGIIPFQYFNYRFEGPNQGEVLNTYQKKMQSVNILSNRETQVLKLIGKGLSSQEIGLELFISRLTVDKHRRNIIEKLGTTSALKAYQLCKNMGFF